MESLGLSRKDAQFRNEWRRNKVNLEMWPECVRMCARPSVCLSVHCRYCVNTIVVRLCSLQIAPSFCFIESKLRLRPSAGALYGEGADKLAFFERCRRLSHKRYDVGQ